MQSRKIRVLIVDDSAVVQQALKEILEADPEIEVMATAHDPYMAVERLKRCVLFSKRCRQTRPALSLCSTCRKSSPLVSPRAWTESAA